LVGADNDIVGSIAVHVPAGATDLPNVVDCFTVMMASASVAIIEPAMGP
jgi:hypothetical protein